MTGHAIRPVDPQDADRSAHYRRHAAREAAWQSRVARAPWLIEWLLKGRGR